MRMMLRWTVPVEKGNSMVHDGSMGTLIESLMKQLQPEAAYFLAEGGERSGMVFFDMKESSRITSYNVCYTKLLRHLWGQSAFH